MKFDADISCYMLIAVIMLVGMGCVIYDAIRPTPIEIDSEHIVHVGAHANITEAQAVDLAERIVHSERVVKSFPSLVDEFMDVVEKADPETHKQLQESMGELKEKPVVVKFFIWPPL